MAKVKEEAWTLNSADTIAIPAGNRADTPANKWGDLYKYQVPTGQAHILKAGHYFAATLTDTAAAEAGNGDCRIKIVIRDQSEQDEKAIYGPALYIASKEFQDKNLMAKLALQADLAIEEKFFIVIQAFDPVGIDVDSAATYFKLETIRIRSTI